MIPGFLIPLNRFCSVTKSYKEGMEPENDLKIGFEYFLNTISGLMHLTGIRDTTNPSVHFLILESEKSKNDHHCSQYETGIAKEIRQLEVSAYREKNSDKEENDISR